MRKARVVAMFTAWVRSEVPIRWGSFAATAFFIDPLFSTRFWKHRSPRGVAFFSRHEPQGVPAKEMAEDEAGYFGSNRFIAAATASATARSTSNEV